jgi:hypothetical protein
VIARLPVTQASLLPDAKCCGPHEIAPGKVARFARVMARGLVTLSPPLTPEEWQAIADRFAGANDPVGQSILAKARHRARAD